MLIKIENLCRVLIIDSTHLSLKPVFAVSPVFLMFNFNLLPLVLCSSSVVRVHALSALSNIQSRTGNSMSAGGNFLTRVVCASQSVPLSFMQLLTFLSDTYSTNNAARVDR